MITINILNQLDKNKTYCKYCLDNNIITELNWDEELKRFNSCNNHNKNVHSHIIKFEDNNWKIFRGKGEISNFVNIIETDKDIQNMYLNSRFIYLNIKDLNKSIKVEKNENGQFCVSKFLDCIEYIHSNHKDPFIIYKVDLIGICNFCKKEFNFKELSSSLKESGLHFCCNNHSLQYRNRTPEMIENSSKRMIEWHKTKEGKEFTRKHYIELGNSKLAKENLCKGREIAKETWVGSERQKDYLRKLVKKNQQSGLCTHCGIFSETRDAFGLCKNCNFGIGNNFNRKEFYKNKFNIISFESMDKQVYLKDFDKFKGKFGVWSRWTDENHGNYCLDVCKTKDIGSEMLSSLRSFNSLIENPNQELDTGWKKKYMKQAKDAGIFNNGKIIFKLVTFCGTEKEALAIETQYAHNNKAKYWSPEPGQIIK